MTSYLSPATIRLAVGRLGESRAQSALIDYLVFKRALQLGGSGTVVTGTKSASFVDAIDELARIADPSQSDRPYFSPFGARRDKGRGFKSKKFPSNGPSDTVGGWQSRPARPFEVVPNTSPRAYRPVDRTADELAAFLLVAEGSGMPPASDKPRLVDLAIWLYRNTDLEPYIGSGGELADRLVAEAQSALGLTAVEVEGLFSDDPFDGGMISTDPTPAEPADYLPVPPVQSQKAAPAATASATSKLEPSAVNDVINFVASKGFIFDPWQIAAFITAVRTKPFVILAGISGTGKTKLPKLVAEATGAEFCRIPVRPDWTDSSELLGYERLGEGNTFEPGHLLRVARRAQENPDRQYFALLDEMNVARVEYYLAEVLSHIEERELQIDGSLASDSLVPNASDDGWRSVRLPGNLAIVGSVNMDETTFGFSRKVLDRSFVIEFSTVSLSTVGSVESIVRPNHWSVDDWTQRALSLADHPDRDHEDVGRVIAALSTINESLVSLQMQVGYRVRDEVAMFVLNAHDCPEAFVADDESVINPLDVAIAMKVLPRIQGTGPALRRVLQQLIGWADPSHATASTTGIETESFPFCADRLRMMLERLDEAGFTAFWL